MRIKQLAVSSGMPSEAMQAYDRQAVNVLIRVGVAHWQTENGLRRCVPGSGPRM
jgi:hypothetical protein